MKVYDVIGSERGWQQTLPRKRDAEECRKQLQANANDREHPSPEEKIKVVERKL